MIIIKIMGGFASQVYKFILGAKIADVKHMRLVLDVSDYYDGYFRPYCLNELDLPEFETIRTRDISADYPKLVWIRNSEDMEKMLESQKEQDYYICREESDYAEFMEKHPEFELGIQSPYIRNIKLKENSGFLSNFCEHIKGNTSVGIHIRRGDFVALGQDDNSAYYKAAIAYFYKKDPTTKFYFFSNDLEWVRKEFGVNNSFYYVTAINGNIGDVEELFCLSYCKYRILSSISGYGQLANVLSFFEDKFGYALMKEAETEQYDYKGVEGRIRYLDKKSVRELKTVYDEIKWDEMIEKSEETDLDKRGISHLYLPDMKNVWMKERFHSYKENGKRALECLESISQCSQPGDKLQVLWEEIYGIRFDCKKTFYIVTCEAYSPWFRRGMFEIAIRLARLGQEVKYINLFDTLEDSDVWMDACNMDGKKYGFQMYKGIFQNIQKELEKCDVILCDCNLGIKTDAVVFKMDSKKARKREKEYFRQLVKHHWKSAFCFKCVHKVLPTENYSILNEYWEEELHRNGKSSEDVQKLVEKVYLEVILFCKNTLH